MKRTGIIIIQLKARDNAIIITFLKTTEILFKYEFKWKENDLNLNYFIYYSFVETQESFMRFLLQMVLQLK